MKTRLKLFLPVFMAATSFIACSDDDTVIDTEKPAISITEPHEGDVFAPGEEFHFEALFTDNVELRSYKIQIHDDFDDHGHSIYKSSHDVNPWFFEDDFTIPAGLTTFNAENHIIIPTEINGAPISEGAYHLSVFVTDAAGNQQEAFRDFEIGDTHEEHTH